MSKKVFEQVIKSGHQIQNTKDQVQIFNSKVLGLYSVVMSKKVFELVIKLLCSRIFQPFFHRMKVIWENFAVSNFFWTERQIECFCLLGFKALWLMVTFLPPLNSADILIFHRRSIFRSLIFGPDFCPHWMFHPFFKAPRAHQKMKGSAEYAWDGLPFAWIRQNLTFHFAKQQQLLHFFHQAFRPGSSSFVGISQKFLPQILSHLPNPPPNPKISKWKEWQQFGAVWSDLLWSTASGRSAYSHQLSWTLISLHLNVDIPKMFSKVFRNITCKSSLYVLVYFLPAQLPLNEQLKCDH